MYRKYIFFCYFLLLNDCYGCQTKEKDILCSLFLKARKIVKGDFRKFTRNIIQRDAPGTKTLPDIIQDKNRHYKVEKQPLNTKNTGISTLLMFQTNSFKANVGNGSKIQYKSSKLPKYTVSESPMLKNRNFKRDNGEQVTVGSTILFETRAYPKDLKASESPRIYNNFKRDSEKPVAEGNAFRYDTNISDMKISKSPNLRNSNFKNVMEEERLINNTIHYDSGRHTKDVIITKAIKLPVLQDNRSARVKREVGKDSRIYYDADHISKGKGIKILEQDPGETQCNYNQCVEICDTIYFAIPIHLAQCYNNSCFCFPKKDLYPPVIKNFMRNHKLFGIQQTYE